MEEKHYGSRTPRRRNKRAAGHNLTENRSGPASRRDLIDPELFGNEAGDDEDVEILNSYFVEKPEFQRFFSPATRLAFVRSRKGVGKSALLRQTLYKRMSESGSELLIHLKCSDLAAMQDVGATSPDELIYGWQQRICTQVNRELGAVLKVGFSDDTISLIESAELAGFRNRNLVSALFDRLNFKGLGAEIERTRAAIGDPQAVLTRVLEKKDVTVWLLVDDVDATFINTEHERLKASTFFSACRNLVNAVSGLCIRAAVRTDVWSVLAQYDEALDKCEQYMLDLTWSTSETGQILANKISSFFRRYYPDNEHYRSLDPNRDADAVRQIVFKEPFPWGTRHLESFRPIHILSAGRPRWAAQLCKIAGKDAAEKSASRISIGHIRDALRAYGSLRVNDLYKEHRHQCPLLQEIVESFSGGPRRFSTDELIDHIARKVITRIGIPQIDGISAERGALSVAHFLFRCGFIAARDEEDPAGLNFIRFEERPNLLSTKANLDDGMSWEIHPSYRQVLRIQGKGPEPWSNV